jgi:hypothetical protein
VDATLLVRGLYEAYQDRDWELAATFLHQEAVLDMPATAERFFGREAISCSRPLTPSRGAS